jgi:hypothetical protein
LPVVSPQPTPTPTPTPSPSDSPIASGDGTKPPIVEPPHGQVLGDSTGPNDPPATN